MSDPNYANVVLLALNENGTDTSTTFIDQSAAPHTLTASGAAQWDTAQYPTGMTSSGLFDGTTDFIYSADSADWNLAAGAWTIEEMVRFNSLADYAFLLAQWDKGASYTNASWGIVAPRSGDANMYLEWTANGSTLGYVFVPWSPSLNTWYHVEVVRSGNSVYFFVNGTQIGTTQTVTATFYNSTANLTIGAVADGSFSLNGWESNVRLTKGVARHTANFTPPTLPLPTSGPSGNPYYAYAQQ